MLKDKSGEVIYNSLEEDIKTAKTENPNKEGDLDKLLGRMEQKKGQNLYEKLKLILNLPESNVVNNATAFPNLYYYVKAKHPELNNATARAISKCREESFQMAAALDYDILAPYIQNAKITGKKIVIDFPQYTIEGYIYNHNWKQIPKEMANQQYVQQQQQQQRIQQQLFLQQQQQQQIQQQWIQQQQQWLQQQQQHQQIQQQLSPEQQQQWIQNQQQWIQQQLQLIQQQCPVQQQWIQEQQQWLNQQQQWLNQQQQFLNQQQQPVVMQEDLVNSNQSDENSDWQDSF